MMQIGELARLAGVTTQTIRHYHRIGLLPEPRRTSGGYRSYGMSALSRLLHIRKLTALGLGLSEVADALADTGAVDIREMLTELDATLAAEAAEIQRRRVAIAHLLEHGDDPTLSPELAAAVRGLDLPQHDVDVLRAVEVAVPEEVDSYLAGIRQDSPWRDWSAKLAVLVDAGANDPRVEEIARELYAMLPDLLPAHVPAEPTADQRAAVASRARFGQMMSADLSPGQRRVLELLVEYGRREPERWEHLTTDTAAPSDR
ncbi:MerR family transcriptional regulator [Nonomuraea jiangxiensis]|uniref:DNA-binding transcriptional regulator, MerR family n=1 Tax=Nonomuraea jiangxiensis TaxID=633440 RepID=A0A1G9WC93_9ACTN|nr:MerR family DNA-binding transcriptional regulator [Nonomuraea jiangxiensis]SDM82194.1 DNA-binding transcriptional regulator, MerR family [Nonomuraea jiangxiensis]